MRFAVSLQLAGVAVGMAGVDVLFGLGWTLVAGGLALSGVGWTLEQAAHQRHEGG
jgi:hypothetical protein